MRTYLPAITATAVAALALSTAVLAQNVPSQFVVTGAAAEKIQDYNTINLATAERIANSCEQMAQQYAPISLTVWDAAGNEVYMDRMDGQDFTNITTAEQKAKTAWSDRASSHIRLNQALADPMQNELRSYQLGEFPNSGGLPIVVNKQMIGVLGVGGAAGQPGFNDEICGNHALTEVFGPQPPIVQPLPREQQAPRPRRTPPLPVPKFEPPIPKSSLPAEWVVTGKAAALNIHDAYQISLAAAKRVAKVCRDWAAARNSSASIYVIDSHANLVHAERMDGQVYNNIRTALLKAQTALKTSEPTSARAARVQNDPSTAPRQIMWLNLFSQSGGIPILIDGQTIGAIGVGGVAGPNNDENCAVEGLKTVFGDRVTLPVYPQQAAAGQRAG